MLLHSEKTTYEVCSKIAEAPTYRLYVAKEDSKDLLLRVPLDLDGNGNLEREAFLLDYLSKMSAEYEMEYADTNPGTAKKLLYNWLFPAIVDSFVSEDQGGRRVNILALSGAEVAHVAPLVKLKAREKIDVKTSAWILGRLLKLQGFANEVGVDYDFSSDEVLLDPKNHKVIYLGWAAARMDDDVDPRPNIRAAAQSILDWTAANGTADEDQYLELVRDLAKSGRRTALEAHQDFYALIRSLWGSQYHPYTTVSN